MCEVRESIHLISGTPIRPPKCTSMFPEILFVLREHAMLNKNYFIATEMAHNKKNTTLPILKYFTRDGFIVKLTKETFITRI